ncbi:MAG: hypothetical protein ACOC3V_00350, partial [bacterium]
MASLVKRTPGIISSQQRWKDLLEVLEGELDSVKDYFKKDIEYLNLDNYSDIEELVILSKSYGYSPSLVLKEDIDFVKHEVASIYYKIVTKATYEYFNYVFKLIPYPGVVVSLYKDTMKLIRAINFGETLDKLSTSALDEPFIRTVPILHFDTITIETLRLDSNPLLYLDNTIFPWNLDQGTLIKPTKHICLEYEANELITYESKEYILIPSYFQFLTEMALYGKKVTDVPHVGVILNFIMDESGIYNVYTGSDYSNDTLKTKSAITDNYIYYAQGEAMENIFYKIKVGTGTKTFPKNSILSVTSLSSPVYEERLSINEIYENDKWIFSNFTVPANRVNIEKITTSLASTGSVVSDTYRYYSGNLDYNNINYSLFELTYKSDNINYIVTITEDGTLIGDAINGAVDLETGAYEFYTYKDYPVVNEVLASNRSLSTLDTTLGNPNVIGNSIRLYYWISGTQYIGVDDGLGNIT